MARILLGVTTSIAAYKACELTRLLVRGGHDVIPLVSPGTERFVTAELFGALARRPAGEDPYPHLESADLLAVAPCSANTLAKLAHGLADTVLTEAALAHRGPVLVAPAMNPRMWSHPATAANAATLAARGVELIGPEAGEHAEGEWGLGRMSEPEAILRRVEELLVHAGSLRGRRVLVSAGGSREPLDAVRFVGNRSSGRMGVELAAEAQRRGAEVTLLAANLAVHPPHGVEVVETSTAEDILREALARSDADLVLMAAAVADYRPAAALAGKRPKSGEEWTIELTPTIDVLRTLGERRTNGQVLVGFAADGGESGLARAREKLGRKGADLIFFNDVSRADIGFDAADNELVMIGREGEWLIERAPKRVIAARVLDEAASLLHSEAGAE